MTTDIATLGLRIESGNAALATERLDHLAGAAGRAEIAAAGLVGAHGKAAQATKALSNEARGMASAMTAIDGPLGGVAGRMRALVTTVREAGPLFATVALSFSAIGFSAGAAIAKTMAFQKSMAEVSTLVDTTKVSMSQLTKAVIEQSDKFAEAPTAEAKALYQIISAGATNAKTATEYLTAANRLAVGGITDLFTAADGLTSIMNAYAGKVKSVQSVSDSLFVAMRDGKTTIGELTSTLGRVAPIAAQSGVSLDQLNASIAALSSSGINTDEAVVGMRDVLTSILRPTAQAKKEAAALGLEFSTTALKADGLQKFLTILMEKTHGNADVLAKLFGSVRGIVPVLALAGSAGARFNSIMSDMAHKHGATADAVNKMKTPGFEMHRMFTTAGNEGITALSGIVTKMGPVFKMIADNMAKISHWVGIASETIFSIFVARMISKYIPAMAEAAAAQARYSMAVMSGNAVSIDSAQAEAMRAKMVADSAWADVEATKATETLLAANVAGLRASLAVADTDRARIGITNLLTGQEGRLAAATDAVAAATARASAATEVYDGALAETGLFARAAATATGLLDSALAFVGGPIGAAVLGLGAAFYELYERSQMSARAMASTNDQMIQAAINADQADISMLKYLSTLVQYTKILAFLPGMGPSTFAVGDMTQKYIQGRIQSLTRDTNRLTSHQAPLMQPVTITPNMSFASPAPTLSSDWSPPSSTGASRSSILQRQIANLNQQGQADRVSGPNRDVILEQLKVEMALRRELKTSDKNLTEQQLNDLSRLKPAEAEQIAALVRRNDAWKEQSKILDGITSSVTQYVDALKALKNLEAHHKITSLDAQVYQANLPINRKVLALQTHLYKTSNPFSTSMPHEVAAQNTATDNTKNSQLKTVQDALQAGVISTQEAARMRVLIETQANQKIADNYTLMYHSQLQMGQMTFGKLADAVAGFAGKSSDAYRILFGIQKAFAIAQAEVNIQAALSEALKQPFPANLADFATVASQGASIIQDITSVAGFASGVIAVQGPGSGTSDSMLARLSAGESVVTAAGTQGNESTLAAINAGAKFDALKALGGGGVNVQVNIPVDARGAQQGVAEQINATLAVVGPQIAAAAVAEAQRRSPAWVAKANQNPRKR